ncbi:unnamed protein product [Ambrosiozyma monospora]|uniref:Unnamed protein product n=1 Tax=Ambrosiozyma monospora TaxID=43982 RepID=A0ACB5TCR7_AMBMO|nr:unnamed protein product [Ambrosiozyma monospora]
MSTYNNYGGFTDQTGYGNYNNSSAGGFTDGPTSSQQQRHTQTQTVTPMTIKSLNAATQPAQDSAFEFEGIELFYVSFLGVIRDIDTSNASSTIYKVEDGTDAISFRQWNDSNDDFENDNQDEPLKVGEYVRVVATLREFNNKKQLQTQSVHRIKDFNEVPYHFLSAIKVYVDHTTGGGVKKQSDSLFVSDDGPAASSGAKSGSMVDRIFDFINENSRSLPEGVPIQLMAQDLNISLDDVQKYINILSDDGRIYASNDDDMYLTV